MSEIQVLIVGAGPSGVVAAYALALRGIRVMLCEAQSHCVEDMRASTFHAPTLEMMSTLGLFEALDAQGLRAPVYHYRNRRSNETFAFDLSEIADATPHPYRLQCEQFKLTRLVTEKLHAMPNAEVKFNHRLVHLEQDASGVTARFDTPMALETYRADYVIGADGASSLVRKWLDVEFEGFTYPEKFLTLSTDYPLEDVFPNLANVSYMADAGEWCVLLRVPTLWRVLVPVADSDADTDCTSVEKKNAVFDGLLGAGEGRHIRTEHRTAYRVHQRVAKTYVRGRIALAGDAAHLNNPLGGFGMNSGVHDAWNLVDKLTEILLNNGDAETLLARYERQRRTVMLEFVQAQTMRNREALQYTSIEAQQAQERQMAAMIADPVKRREHLLRQSMLISRVREREIH